MKKSLLLPVVAAVFCLQQYAGAQNASPYWSLAGNSNATTSSKLGTTNAIPLRLFTNNATRVYINTSGNVGIGNSSPAQKLHVSGNTYISGKVGIGTTALTYRLNVVNTGTAIYGNSTAGGYGVYGKSNYIGVLGEGNSYGLYGFTASSTTGTGVLGAGEYGVYGNGGTYGVYGYTSNGSGYGVYGNGANYGVYGFTTGNYGVFGNAGTVGVYGQGGSYGVAGSATTSSGYGVYGQGGSNGVYGSGSSYGVVGWSSTQTGVYGYTGGGGTGSPSAVYGYNASYGYGVRGHSVNGSGIYGSGAIYAGYFTGAVYAQTYSGSDRKLKKNITDIESAMDVINKLHPKAYEFRQDDNYKLMHLPQGTHYGLIAQELEQVLPNLIKETQFDTQLEQPGEIIKPGTPSSKPNTAAPSEVINFKAVNYTELIPILVKAVQEQQQEIEKQQQEIEILKEQVKSLSKGNNSITALSNATLGQASPNPVKSIARIKYEVPENAVNAKLLLSDALGRTLKVIPLSRSGVLDLDATSLSSGVYNYSLIVDNQTVSTKKMTVVR